MSKFKTFVINAFVLFFSSILIQIIMLLFNVYISNKIGAEAVGVFTLVSSVYFFGITLATSGINIATTRIVSEELACNNNLGVKIAAKKSIAISFITGLIASTIFYIFSDFIVSKCLHNRVSSIVIYVICIALPFISISSAINGYFTAVRRAYKNAIGRFYEKIIQIMITAFILNHFMPTGINYMCLSLIFGDVASEIFSFSFIFYLYLKDKQKHIDKQKLLKKHLGFNRSYIDKKDEISYSKRILRISLPVAFTSYLKSGLSTLKQILIPFCLEKSKSGCSLALSNYGIIAGMAMPIVFFPSVFITSFAPLLIPEFSRYLVKKDFTKIKKMSLLIIFFTMCFSIIVNFILFVFSNNLAIMIYNNIDIGNYIRILSFLTIFMYNDIVIDSILKGLDAQVSVVFINIIDCIVTILFIYIFVPKFGIVGYIFSIYISEILNIILSAGKLAILLRKISK